MNLSLLIILPFITAVLILFCRTSKQVRSVAFSGSLLQLSFSVYLLLMYIAERKAGTIAPMLFEFNHAWFASLNINYHIGVDGISIAMILLTSFVVTAGILVSWNMET